MDYRDEMIRLWYEKYPHAIGLISQDVVIKEISRIEEEIRPFVDEAIKDSIIPMRKTTQELRIELDKLQVEIRENALDSGADMGQVREMFMLQWEEFAGYRI